MQSNLLWDTTLYNKIASNVALGLYWGLLHHGEAHDLYGSWGNCTIWLSWHYRLYWIVCFLLSGLSTRSGLDYARAKMVLGIATVFLFW